MFRIFFQIDLILGNQGFHLQLDNLTADDFYFCCKGWKWTCYNHPITIAYNGGGSGGCSAIHELIATNTPPYEKTSRPKTHWSKYWVYVHVTILQEIGMKLNVMLQTNL